MPACSSGGSMIHEKTSLEGGLITLRTAHDDSGCPWDMVGEAVRAAFAEIKLEHCKSDFQGRCQPALDQFGLRERPEYLFRSISKAPPDFSTGFIRDHRLCPPQKADPVDRQPLPRTADDVQSIYPPVRAPFGVAGTDGHGLPPCVPVSRLLPAPSGVWKWSAGPNGTGGQVRRRCESRPSSP